MLNFIIKHSFSTPKSYSSSFRIRSRLADFFKHVHPDQLHQAPTKVKEQNLRSLTNFNAYIDAINQKKPIQGKLLKFYLSEKTNLKSKKFYSFSIQLPSINSESQITQQKRGKLVDNIVEVLNRKFLQSKLGGKIQKNGKQKVEGINEDFLKQRQSKEQKFHRMVSQISPFNKKRNESTEQERQLQSSLNAKYMQAQKDALSTKLRKSISFADTRSNKPMMWSRIATEESGVFKDFQAIFDELIDPRLIYFHESLTLDEIETFKNRILPGSMSRNSYNDFKIIADICRKMQSNDPPLCFYVHDRYSGVDIPGFFTIPFNFKAKQLQQKFNQLQDTILQERQKYQQFYDYYLQLREQIKNENRIFVQQTQFRDNNSIWMHILALKRLQKYVPHSETTIVIFSPQQLSLLKEKYELKGEGTCWWKNGKLLISIDFGDEDLQQALAQKDSI